jgi:hypothetical protein
VAPGAFFSSKAFHGVLAKLHPPPHSTSVPGALSIFQTFSSQGYIDNYSDLTIDIMLAISYRSLPAMIQIIY